jgi:hypothetical protein
LSTECGLMDKCVRGQTGYRIHCSDTAASLGDPSLSHVHIDISWDETAKYITGSPEALEATAALINKYPDRLLFGSDVVAPPMTKKPWEQLELHLTLMTGIVLCLKPGFVWGAFLWYLP